jgi:sigma-B regulation protein RsbU (phosphoserine phosphatase)
LEFRHQPRRILEAVLLLALLLVVGRALFGNGQFRAVLGAYSFIPFLIWAALRFGPNGTALSALAVAGIAIWGTIRGFGPFVGEPPDASLLSLQAFICIATATGLVLSAALAERKEAEAALRRARDGLELRVQERTAQVAQANQALQGEITERMRAYEVAEAERIVLERELQVAHDVQASLIPREMPEIPGFSLAGAWIPASEVAGDFYDTFPLAEGRWGIVIGDVAHKGTAAVLYMAMVRSLIRSAALRNRGPAEVLVEVNRTILLQYPAVMFATIFLAVVDPKKQTFQYANAGHNPPMVRRASGTIESLVRTGSVVGVLEELELSEATITLGGGEAVVLYTDGATEALNPREAEYGAERLTAAIAAAPRKASELLAHVEADLNAFTQGAPPQDDITFFVLTKD